LVALNRFTDELQLLFSNATLNKLPITYLSLSVVVSKRRKTWIGVQPIAIGKAGTGPVA